MHSMQLSDIAEIPMLLFASRHKVGLRVPLKWSSWMCPRTRLECAVRCVLVSMVEQTGSPLTDASGASR